MNLVFSSLLFIFLYLPLVLIIYYATPKKFKNFTLLIANLIFYGWGEPVFICIMIISTIFNYTFGLLIEKYHYNKKIAKTFLVLSITINLGLLGFFKYTNFIIDILKVMPIFSSVSAPLIPLPLGISFYTFQKISYIIDVYRKDTPPQRNLIFFATYVSLFPQLIAGPIVRYKDVATQLNERHENINQFSDGIRLFLIGLAKKILIANEMGLLWDNLRITFQNNGLLGAWIGALAFTLQIYFDFSGYSDMARGLGKMFGFEFMINFNYPYISKSITEFWRRWHISLSTWFRDYVYIPLGGNRVTKFRLILNLFIVWFLTGLWHGASLNFIIWGLYYFFLLIIEKFFLVKYLNKLPNTIAHIYSLFLIMLGWIIFYFEDLSLLLKYLSSMFSLQNGIISSNALALIISYCPLIIIAILACLPIFKNFYFRIRNNTYFYITELISCLVIMLLCTATLVGGSYNPFLYFRF